MKKSVFISYCSKNRRYIEKMTQMLDKMGITYWIAPDMIPAGSNYAREIPGAIRQCEVFLLVLSKESQQSIWVEKEIDSAINYRRTIVPFQIDDEPLSEMFRFYLNNVQTIYCVNRPKEAIEELKDRLRNLLDIPRDISSPEIKKTGNKSDRGPKEAEGKTDRDVKEAEGKIDRDAKEAEGKRDRDPKEAEGKTEPDVKEAEDKKDRDPKKTENKIDRGAKEDKSEKNSKNTEYTQETEDRETSRGRRESFLRASGIPTKCRFCGGDLKMISKGVYRCRKCGKENYDYLRRVQNFLRKNGAKPAIVIERETGVPRKIIEQLLEQEYLEIPKLEPIRLSCAKCGAPIRTGTLCDYCKRKESRTIKEKTPASWRSSRRR